MNTRYYQATLLALLFLSFSHFEVLAQDTRVGDFCVNDLGGNSCTANDLEVVGAVVTSTIDPCVAVGDTGIFTVDFTIGSGNATTRYDIGLYFAADGGSAYDGDNCIHTTSGDGQDLDGTPGDFCLDTSSASNLISEETITILCTDSDANSVVDPLSTCASWKQGNASDTDCMDVSGAVPGTPSKCNCSTIDLNIPIDPALAVEYANIDVANDKDNTLSLTWTTSTEENNSGFEIQLSTDGIDFSREAWVDGQGTSLEENNYRYQINDLQAGRYYLRLKQIDYDGTSNLSQVLEGEVSIPNDFLLSEVYPNPFNPSARIQFGVPNAVEVTLGLYDITGRLIEVLYQGTPEANTMIDANIDGSSLSSGIYLVRLDGPNFSAVRRASMVK